MEQAGCRIVRHYRHMAYMGFAAVVANLAEVRRNFRIAESTLRQEQPDVLILIDYPTFNLKIAAFCRRHLPRTKIVYYIPPKIWAWKGWRIHRIGRLCDLVLGIFPFEPKYYKERGYTCTYVGNPTVEELQNCKFTNQQICKSANIAVVPGSRRSEIVHCLPVMLEAARQHGKHIVVTTAPGIEDNLYTPYLHAGEELCHDTRRAVAEAELAIVNSGTATLETALIGTPQIAVYHLAWSRLLGILRPLQRTVFPLPYFTLPNILLDRPLIPELLANEFTAERISAEISRLTNDKTTLQRMQSGYEQLRLVLGTQSASDTAASLITNP